MKNSTRHFLKILMTMAIAVGACLIAVNTKAAGKKSTVAFRDISGYSTSEDHRVKVGSYYFYADGDTYYAGKSDTKDGSKLVGDIEGAFITNGKDAYYAKNKYIYKISVSSKKKTKIKKIGEDRDVVFVYSSSIFYQEVSDTGVAEIRCYNSKKKTDKSITTTADALSITGYGKYLLYSDSDSKALLMRNCSEGTTKTISTTACSYLASDGKQVLYTTSINGRNYIMSYDIKTEVTTLVQEIATTITNGKFTADCKTFAYEMAGSYYTMDLATKSVVMISAADYTELF